MNELIKGAFITRNRQFEGFEVTDEGFKKMIEEIIDAKEEYPDFSHENLISIRMLMEMIRKNDQDLFDGDAQDEGFEGLAKILKELGEDIAGELGGIQNKL